MSLICTYQNIDKQIIARGLNAIISRKTDAISEINDTEPRHKCKQSQQIIT